jgi:hypothetical protein
VNIAEHKHPKERAWYVKRAECQYGPYSDHQLRELVDRNLLHPDDLLGCSDLEGWFPFGSFDLSTASRRTSARRYVHSLIHFVSRRVAAEPVSLIKRIWTIVTRPSEFAAKYVDESEPKALFDAAKFYIKLLAIALAAHLLVSHFRLYEGGESELRYLAILIPQLIIGISVVYLLLVVSRNRVPLLGLIQIVLYADAIYLLLDAVLDSSYAYLNYALMHPIGGREIDIFSSELEKCISTHSFTYWLIRGVLKFVLYGDKWRPADWITWFEDKRLYIGAIPLFVLFAYLSRAKYRVNLFVGVLSSGIAFACAVEAYEWGEANLRSVIASKSDCGRTYVNEVVAHYPAEKIASQLEFKLNNELHRTFHKIAPYQMLALEGTEFVLRLRVPFSSQLNSYVAGAADSFLKGYCSANEFWRAMRLINYPLHLSILAPDGSLLYQRRFRVSDCPAGN